MRGSTAFLLSLGAALVGVVATVSLSLGVVLQLARVALALERTHGWWLGLAVAGTLAAMLSSALLWASRAQTRCAAVGFVVMVAAVVGGGLAGAEVLQTEIGEERTREGVVLPPVTQVVVAREFEFSEAFIKMAPGYRAVELRNEGTVVHSMRIESMPGVRLEAPPGTSHVEAGRLEPGVHIFFCQVPGHRAAGMEGTLVVY